MKSETSPDPEKLQLLIDGELSTDDTKALLESADLHPSHWRIIACEFVEDQLFRRQFESMTELAEQPRSPQPAATKKELPSRRTNRATPVVRQLAIAAGVAVAGLIGYLVGSDQPITNPTDHNPGANMIASSDPVATPGVTPVDLKPEYRMELLSPEGEALNEVDLYRYNDLNRIYANRNGRDRLSLEDMLPASGFSNEMREQLSQSGYQINESTNYVSGRLDDGRQFVVPVRSIRFDRGH